jgi:hypothetical protein
MSLSIHLKCYHHLFGARIRKLHRNALAIESPAQLWASVKRICRLGALRNRNSGGQLHYSRGKEPSPLANVVVREPLSRHLEYPRTLDSIPSLKSPR